MGFPAPRPVAPHGDDDDVDALLRDVSAFLHDADTAPAPAQDASGSGSNGSGSNGSGSNGSGGSKEEDKRARQRALAARRRRAYRERSSAELLALRRQEQELGSRLAALLGGQPTAVTATAVVSRREKNPVWRELAVRQREGRVAAERLQRRLRAQVAARQSFIEDVARALCRRPSVGGDIPADSENLLTSSPGQATDSPGQTKPTIELADASLFETYLTELDDAYARTDEVLRDSGLCAQADTSRNQRIRHRREHDIDYVEVVDSIVLPFDFAQIHPVLWAAVVRVHRRADRAEYFGAHDRSDTHAVKFEVKCRPRDGDCDPVPLVICLALRRYVEADRVVMVWRAFSEGLGAVTGLNSDETGWSVVRAADTGEGTINQTIVRFETIRMHADCAVTAAPDEELFAKLIASSADEDGEEISRLMASLVVAGDAH